MACGFCCYDGKDVKSTRYECCLFRISLIVVYNLCKMLCKMFLHINYIHAHFVFL